MQCVATQLIRFATNGPYFPCGVFIFFTEIKNHIILTDHVIYSK